MQNQNSDKIVVNGIEHDITTIGKDEYLVRQKNDIVVYKIRLNRFVNNTFLGILESSKKRFVDGILTIEDSIKEIHKMRYLNEIEEDSNTK